MGMSLWIHGYSLKREASLIKGSGEYLYVYDYMCMMYMYMYMYTHKYLH